MAESFKSGLKIVQEDQTTILTLSYDTDIQTLGVDLLNVLMLVYDSLNLEDKNRISTNTLNFINRNLDTVNFELNNSQGRIKSYKVSNNVFDIEGQSKTYLANIGDATKSIEVQEVRMNILNWLLNYVNDEKNKFELVPTNLGIEELALTQLEAEYNKLQLDRESNLKTTKPNNPLILAMESALEKIRKNIAQALLNVRESYLITKNNLLEQQQNMQGQLNSLPGKSMELGNVQRRGKILEDLYSFLLQKRLETSISSASTISNTKIIEPAISSASPISPNKNKIFTFYLLMGLIIPSGLIVFRELMRDKVDQRLDVEKRTNAPILAEIGHSDDESDLVVTKNSRRFVAEQFR
ncbi:MAG TPA: GNVR domain-containing protein, partial [Nitrosopumilaceae archaeon]|nr:GNVR domain-containing protein [Nitrosopumilaceae archaeon]